jgi:hypothetical protein
MTTYIPNLKWAWQVQFLSHTLLIEKINTTLNDIDMSFLFVYWFQIFKDQFGVFPPF